LSEEEGSAMPVASASSMTAMDGAVREIGTGLRVRSSALPRRPGITVQELFPEESS
jgi:hypothetical protein